MIKRTLMLTACTAMICSLASVQADESRFSGGVGVGTTGLTLDGKLKLSERLYVRTGFNYLEFDLDDKDFEGISYDVETDFTTLNATVDFHPFGNSFFISGGVYAGERTLDMSATPVADVIIGGQTFTAADIGTLQGSATLGEDIAPFLGLGFDSRASSEGPFSYFVQAGVIFTGSPDVSLTSVGGLLSNQQLFLDELAIEEAQLQDDLESYEYYPVLNVGLTYNF